MIWREIKSDNMQGKNGRINKEFIDRINQGSNKK